MTKEDIKLCIKESRCIQCRMCEKVCPTGAMRFEGDNAVNTHRIYDESKCFRCGLCVDVCPKNVFVFSDKDEGDKVSKSKVPDFQSNPNRFSKIAKYKAQVKDIAWISHKVILLEVKIIGNKKFQFIAGQYADIYYADEFLRPYSISSAPIVSSANNIVEFTIEVVPKGLGSEALTDLQIGDTIAISGPYGALVLEENIDQSVPYVFIATGTGIAPFKSMIDQLILTNSKNPIHLVFGLRSEEDVFYREHFTKYQTFYPNFTFEFCLSQPSDEWKGFHGRVTDYIQNYKVENKNTRFYICGLSPMIQSVKKIFQDRELSFKYVFYEQFDS